MKERFTDSSRSDSDEDIVSQNRFKKIRNNVNRVVSVLKEDRLAVIGIGILSMYLFVAMFAPMLAPYDPGQEQTGEDGTLLRTEGPSENHLLGTTNYGQDVFSQVIVSTRVSVIVGLLGALIAVFIGSNVALLSAYHGGWVDDILMRVVDIAYGLPFLPFVIVLVFIFGSSLTNIIFVIGALLWRDSARVIRSEVLTQKERPYVRSAKAIGASDTRILYRHILPNVLPLVGLYMAFAVAYAVIYEASLAFLGFGDPTLFSWGQMLFQAYNAGVIGTAWWWVLPPGFSLMLLVMSVFFIGRALEEITNPEIR